MSKSWSAIDALVIMLGGLVFAVLGALVGAAMGGDDLVFISALLGHYFGYLGILWIMKRGRADSDLGFSIERSDLIYLPLGSLLQLGLTILFFPATKALFSEGESVQDLSEALVELDQPWIRIASFAAIVVLVPVVEELVFRGVLVKALSNRGNRYIIVVTAAIFAGIHITGITGDKFLAGVVVVLPRLFIIGMVLAWLTLKHRRLGPAIFLHSGVNFLAALIFLLPPSALTG